MPWSASVAAAIAAGSMTRPRRLAVPSSSVVSRPRLGVGEGVSSDSVRIGIEREDRREVGLGGARKAQPVLLGSRMGALVRADAAGSVLLHADAREEALPGTGAAVGSGVILSQRPQARLLVGDQHPLPAPVGELGRRPLVAIFAPFGKIDAHDVVRRARFELGALLGIDHVVGGSHDRLEAVGLLEVVAERVQGLDLGHAASEAIRPSIRIAGSLGAWRSLVARLLWEQEVPGSNPGAPIKPRPAPDVRVKQATLPVDKTLMSSAPAVRRSTVRLFAVYAVITLVPVLILGAVLAISFRNDANRRGLDQGLSEADLIAQTALEPQFDGRPLGAGLSATEQARLSRLVNRAVREGDVLRLGCAT